MMVATRRNRRRSQRPRTARSGNSDASRIVSVDSNYTGSITFGTAPDVQQLIFRTVNLGPRGLTVSKGFEFYRVRSAQVKIYNGNIMTSTGLPAGGLTGVGWVPGVPTAAPTAFDDIAQMPKYALMSLGSSNPRSFNLRSGDLIAANQVKWWRNNVTTVVEPVAEYQGVLYFATNLTSSKIYYEVSLQIEFSGPIAETQLSYVPQIVRLDDDDEKETQEPGSPTFSVISSRDKMEPAARASRPHKRL